MMSSPLRKPSLAGTTACGAGQAVSCDVRNDLLHCRGDTSVAL